VNYFIRFFKNIVKKKTQEHAGGCLFSGEPGWPAGEKGDRLERLIELLRGLDATDLEQFAEILPRLVKWKGDK